MLMEYAEVFMMLREFYAVNKHFHMSDGRTWGLKYKSAKYGPGHLKEIF